MFKERKWRRMVERYRELADGALHHVSVLEAEVDRLNANHAGLLLHVQALQLALDRSMKVSEGWRALADRKNYWERTPVEDAHA